MFRIRRIQGSHDGLSGKAAARVSIPFVAAGPFRLKPRSLEGTWHPVTCGLLPPRLGLAVRRRYGKPPARTPAGQQDTLPVVGGGVMLKDITTVLWEEYEIRFRHTLGWVILHEFDNHWKHKGNATFTLNVSFKSIL